LSEALASGIIHGRPCGGVAFLWKNHLSQFITKIGFDDADRCIGVKLSVQDKVILLVKVHSVWVDAAYCG